MKQAKRILTVLLALCLLLALSACAGTQKEEVAASEEDCTLEQKLDGDPVPYVRPKPEQTGGRYDVEKTFTDADGVITYTFRAKLTSPDVEAIPVLEVAPHFFTSDDLERMTRALCGDAPVYEYRDVLTKRLCELEIERLTFFLDPDSINDQEQIDSQAANVLQRITELQQLQETAPTDEEVDRPLTDYTFRPDDEWDHSRGLTPAVIGTHELSSWMATATVEDGIPVILKATVRNDSSCTLSRFCYSIGEPSNLTLGEHTFLQTEPFTDEQIENGLDALRQTVTVFGTGRWVLQSYEIITVDLSATQEDGLRPTDPAQEGECVHYSLVTVWSPVYENVPVMELPTSAADYEYESLRICVSNGVIQSVEYRSPLDVVSKRTESVEIIPLKEALDRLCRQLQFTFTKDTIRDYANPSGENAAADDSYEVIAARVDVDRVQLGFARVNKKGSGNYYLLPVWTVRGRPYVTERRHRATGRAETLPVPSLTASPGTLLLVMNAVDGTFIDFQT